MTYFSQSTIPIGAVAARSLQTRFSDTLNLRDFILPADADHTLALGRAIARAQTLNRPSVIDVPPGAYDFSAATAPAISGSVAIHLRGSGSAVTIFRQNADADGIAVVLQNYGSFGLGGAFNVSGITFQMAAVASTTRTALLITTTGATGGTGCPVVLDDIVVTSPNPGAAHWGVGINVGEIADFAYLSRITVYSSGTLSVGIAISGNAQSYTTGVFLSDITIVGTGTGLVLGDFLQGITIDNLNTVNTRWALRSEPTLPAGDNAFVITRSYLYGKTIFHALEGRTAQFQIRVLGCYFDGNVNGAGAPIDRHVSFINVPQVTLIGCTFNGAQQPPPNPITGLYIENQSYDTIISGNTFGGYGVPGDGSSSVAMYFAASTANITTSNNVFDYNAASIKDLGTGNVVTNTRILRCEAGADGYYFSGTANYFPSTPAIFTGAGVATTSPNSGVEVGSPAVANTPFLDFHSGGGARDYDARIIAAGGSTTADGQAVLNYKAAQHKFDTGVAMWNAVPPTVQPAAPQTLADVIALLRAYGFSA